MSFLDFIQNKTLFYICPKNHIVNKILIFIKSLIFKYVIFVLNYVKMY
jgi:hypothetical protein